MPSDGRRPILGQRGTQKGEDLRIKDYGSNDEVTMNALSAIHLLKQPLAVSNKDVSADCAVRLLLIHTGRSI